MIEIYKKLIHPVLITITAVWVIYIMYIVSMNTLSAFRHLIYTEHSLIQFRAIMLSLLSTEVVSVMLLVFGGGCIFMFFGTYGSINFLKYTEILLLAAGIVATRWSTDILFHIELNQKLIWIKSADAMLVLYVLCLFDLLMKRMFKQHLLIWINRAVSGAVCIVVLGLTPILAVEAMKVYLLFETGVIILTSVLWFRNRKHNAPKRSITLWDLASFPVGYFALFLVAYFKLDTTHALHTLYHQYLMIVIMLYSCALPIVDAFRQRSGLSYRRSQNRRFREAMNVKETVSRLLVEYCTKPIEHIQYLNSSLHQRWEDLPDNAKRNMIDRMFKDVNRLQQHIEYIGRHGTISNLTSSHRMVKTNLPTIFSYVKGNHDSLSINWQYETPDNFKQKLFVCGDPYLLIQANQSLLSSLYEVCTEKHVKITCEPQDNCYQVSMVFHYDKKKKHLVRAIRRVLTSRHGALDAVLDEDDILLTVARNALKQHACQPEVKWFPHQMLRISYRLPMWQEPQTLQPISAPAPENTVTKYNSRIVLISNLPEQIDLIKSYLEYEPYTLYVLNSEENLMDTLQQLGNIKLVIVGTIFLELSVAQICREIRKEYTMGQLPILLIKQNQKINLYGDTEKLVNDTLVEPFPAVTLLQRLHSMALLQASIQDTIKTQLALLQAQMDPHFIFNTISTIMSFCIQEPKRAYELLAYFSDYLRASLFPGELREPIQIYQELDLINAYLQIEKMRYGNRLECDVDVDITSDCTILPLIIEPIVENCIKHGFIEDQRLEIRVAVKQVNEHLQIMVSDNGKGMRTDQLDELLVRKTPGEKNSIGLNNVNKRLQIHYGEKLHITSKPEEGTSVSFQIPVETLG